MQQNIKVAMRPLYPRPCLSAEEFERLFNTDLGRMNHFELLQEQGRLNSGLPRMRKDKIIYVTSTGKVIKAGDWLIARLDAVTGELKRRSNN